MNDQLVEPRVATAADREFVWLVHNEPEVRRWSVQQQPIPWPDHCAWFERRLADDRRRLWVARAEGRDVGVVRADPGASDGEMVLSLALGAAERGRGLGRAAIAAAVRSVFAAPGVSRVVARIRPENVASRRAFAAVGFREVGTEVEAGATLLCAEVERGGRRVLFRCDGGPETGWGHVVRSSALASALAELGCACTFLMQPTSTALVDLLVGAGHEVVLAANADSPTVVAAQLARLAATTLVLDSYVLGGAFLTALQQQMRCTHVVIDDLGDRELPCDVVVNTNPFAEGVDYSGTGARHRLLGPRWALLRPDLLQLDPGSRRHAQSAPSDPPHVLVTLGGSRLGAAALALAQAIVRARVPCRITLLLGDGDGAEAARTWAATAAVPVAVVQAVPSVAALFLAADFAVAAAGTTCFELAACGVPALLLIAADNQRRSAAAWHGRAGFEVLGELGSVGADEVAARVAALVADPTERARRSSLGPRLVDGAGARRTAQVVIEATCLGAGAPR